MKNSIKSLIIPISALLLEVTPFALLYLRFHAGMLLLLFLACPIVGLVLGISSLRKGKKEIGVLGMILSALAVIYPVGLIAYVSYIFIGISTGLISLM